MNAYVLISIDNHLSILERPQYHLTIDDGIFMGNHPIMYGREIRVSDILYPLVIKHSYWK